MVELSSKCRIIPPAHSPIKKTIPTGQGFVNGIFWYSKQNTPHAM
jgi:hypothetical protein